MPKAFGRFLVMIGKRPNTTRATVWVGNQVNDTLRRFTLVSFAYCCWLIVCLQLIAVVVVAVAVVVVAERAEPFGRFGSFSLFQSTLR